MLMRIKELRESAHLTQSQLAARMGVMQNSVSQWESETALPRTRQLPELARIFSCRIDELFLQNQ